MAAPQHGYEMQLVGSDGVTVWDPGSKTLATATIASAATTSGAITLGANTITGMVLPAAFTGTALSFQVSADGATYGALYDSTNTPSGWRGPRRSVSRTTPQPPGATSRTAPPMRPPPFRPRSMP
jgi:hypothetical protein